MTVVTAAQMDVATTSARAALSAVLPLASKLKTEDHQAEHRIRLFFGDGIRPDANEDGVLFEPGWLYAAASNSDGGTIGIAKARIAADSRDLALPADDGAIVVDLQPRQVRLILQQFKASDANTAAMQIMRFGWDLQAGTLTITDVGGLYSDGEELVFPLEPIAEKFPDVLGIAGKALAGAAGKSMQAKPLITDPEILASFKAAGDAYDAPLAFEGSGSTESGAFLVSCGPHFIGTTSSALLTGDSLKRRESTRRNWMTLLPARLKVVGE